MSTASKTFARGGPGTSTDSPIRATASAGLERVRRAGETLAWAYNSGQEQGVKRTASEYAVSSQVQGVNLIGVMFAIILAAAIGMVGVLVISEIDDNINVADGTAFADASDNISTGFADAMSLADIVFLTLMFVVVISALFLARRAGQV